MMRADAVYVTPGKQRRGGSRELGARSCTKSQTPQRRSVTPLTAASRQSRCDIKSWHTRSPGSWSVKSVATPLRVETYFPTQEASLVPAPAAPTYKPPAHLRDNPEGCSLPPDPFGQGWSLPPGPENSSNHSHAASIAQKLSNLRCSALPSPSQLGNSMRSFCSPSREKVGFSPVRPPTRRPLFSERSPKLVEDTLAFTASVSTTTPAIAFQQSPQALEKALAEMGISRNSEVDDLELQGPSLTPPQESPSTSHSQCRLSDPVWGELEFLGRGPTKWQAICFGLCPCLMIPCGGKCCAVRNQNLTSPTHGKRSWNRFFVSFSIGFCILQIVAFVGVVVYAGGFMPVAENPGWGPYPYFLDFWGAKNAARILEEGEWWRLLSPMVLHSSVGHLIINIALQARLAVSLEQFWGHSRWLLVYILSGAYSALASCVVLPDNLSVGSSGAICGVLGAGILYMFVTWRQTEHQDVTDRNVQICTFIATAVVIGVLSALPMADFAAHAGGFVVGLLLAMVLFAERLEKESTKIADRIRSVGCFLLATLVTLTLAYFVWEVEPDRSLLNICKPSEC